MSATERAMFDPSIGVARLSRRHLTALGQLAEGADPGPEQRQLLARAGALLDGRPHPALLAPLSVIGATSSRFWLRRWELDRPSVIEGLIGPAGIVLLPSGSDPDVLQELRYHARPGALARVLATLLRLEPNSLAVRAPRGPLTWMQVRSLVTDNRPAGLGPVAGPTSARLHDLVWQPRLHGPRGSVLVLLQLIRAGLVEARPWAPGDDRYRLERRRSDEVWFGLCRLAAEATATRAGPGPERPAGRAFHRRG